MQGHILVWLDQQSARLFRINHSSPDGVEAGPQQIVHHHGGSHAAPKDDATFFADIAEGLAGASGILIVGPGDMRFALSTWLSGHHPDTAGNVWAVRAIDHLTDPQLIAHGKAYFSAEVKMRA